VYDAYYEVEEVVEKRGLLDENGVLVEGSNCGYLMVMDEGSPHMKEKKTTQQVDDNKSVGSKR
jgi:hypothetical protein